MCNISFVYFLPTGLVSGVVNQVDQYNHSNRSRSKPVNGVNNRWWVLRWAPLQWRCNPARWLTGPWCPWLGWPSRWMYEQHLALHLHMFLCALLDIFAFSFIIANNGLRHQADHDDWPSSWRTFCNGSHAATSNAPNCESPNGSFRPALNKKTRINISKEDTNSIRT